MRKLREENGGYTLLYVLIVVVLLSVVSLSICAIALRNYQAQADSITQMRALYDAEGEIEKFVALAGDIGALEVSDTEYSMESAAKGAYQTALANKWGGVAFKGDGIKSFSCSATHSNGSVQIKADIQIELEYKTIQHPTAEGEAPIPDTYKIDKAIVTKYNAYEITFPITEGGDGK